MKLFSILLIVLTKLVVSDEIARIRVGKGFVYDLGNTFIPQIIQQLSGLSSFEYNFDSTIFHLNIRNMTIDELQYNRSQYTFNFNPNTSSIDIEINCFRININTLIYHKFLLFSNSSGNLLANMNINLKISLGLISDKNGIIQTKLNDFNFNYKGSSISFNGGLFEWSVDRLLNTFEFLTEFIVRQVIKTGINGALKSINSNLLTQINIPQTKSSLQLRVKDKILIDNSYMDLAVKFLFNFNNTRKNLRILDQSFDTDSTEDLKVWINYDLMNSFSKAFFLNNIFNIQVTSNNIPENIPFKINTKYFSHIIPGIYEKYPNKELIITLTATKQPNFLFNKENQSIEFTTKALFSFSLIDQPNISILSFNSDIFLDVRLGSNYTDPSLHLSLKKLEIQKMDITYSEFPSMDIELLRSNLNFTFGIICNAANKFYLLKGIPLSVIQGLRLKKVMIQIEETFFSITIQPDIQNTKFNWLRLY